MPTQTVPNAWREAPTRACSRSTTSGLGPAAADHEVRDHALPAGHPAVQHVGREVGVRRLEAGQHRREVVHHRDAVVADAGDQVGHVAGRDPEVAGPGAGAELHGDRRRDLRGHYGVAVDRDRPTGRLQVDQHVASAVVDPEADHRGVGREPAAPGHLRRTPATPAATLVEGLPVADRGLVRGREPQLDRVVVEHGCVDRRRRGPGRQARLAEVTQRGQEPARAVRRRRRPQPHLGLRRVSVGLHATTTTAVQHERGQHPGGDQPGTGEGTDHRGAHALVGARLVAGQVCHALVGGAVPGVARGVPGPAGAWVGLHAAGLHPWHADGVVGHHQVPAGLDQPRQLQGLAVGLLTTLVEPVDLLVTPPVSQMPLGDVPEVVVVAVARRVDDVHPLAGEALDVGERRGHARQPGLAPGTVALTGALVAGGLATGTVGDRRGHRGIGHDLLRRRGARTHDGAADQQRTHEQPRQRLGRPRERHVPRKSPAAQRAGHLHDHGHHEQCPRQPHHAQQDREQQVGPDRLGQVGLARQAGRNRRRSGERDQPGGHADDQQQQRERSTDGGQRPAARVVVGLVEPRGPLHRRGEGAVVHLPMLLSSVRSAATRWRMPGRRSSRCSPAPAGPWRPGRAR